MIADVTAVILAGGRSSRFGSDKSFALWEGRPVIAHLLDRLSPLFREVLVVAKEPSRFRGLLRPRERAVQDLSDRHHPLVGLATGLRHAGTRYSFFCACDMPLVRVELITALCAAAPGWDAVVPVWRGEPQPMAAVYSEGCLDVLAPASGSFPEGLAVKGFIDRIRPRFLDHDEVSRCDPDGASFEDIDTLEDYRRVRELSLAGAH
ncbi:MAG: molybdenum cofactor guanylyltransferase [Elusimicrobia bacterium]|nr:molybdenum cofactor guanylyltransferase [Elusimicrobiota bacterium]